jgi:transposase
MPAAVYTLIESCKMNNVDPQAWLADVLARLPDHPRHWSAILLRASGRRLRPQFVMG